jgi:hypothetical protein
MRKNNQSIRVDFGKILTLLKDTKWICIVVILFLMVFRVSCGNSEGKFRFEIGCAPIRPSDMKEVMGKKKLREQPEKILYNLFSMYIIGTNR